MSRCDTFSGDLRLWMLLWQIFGRFFLYVRVSDIRCSVISLFNLSIPDWVLMFSWAYVTWSSVSLKLILIEKAELQSSDDCVEIFWVDFLSYDPLISSSYPLDGLKNFSFSSDVKNTFSKASEYMIYVESPRSIMTCDLIIRRISWIQFCFL